MVWNKTKDVFLNKTIYQRLVLVWWGMFLLIFILGAPLLTMAVERNVYYFDIQGLRLNMRLDEVIEKFEINRVKSSKDKYALINGYEIVKQDGEMKIVLNFTGRKRLYRIDYSNSYKEFRQNPDALYERIKLKYGDAAVENIEVGEGETRNIRACWGTTCTMLTPTTPSLKASVYYSTGKMKLTLSDYRIFNTDWQLYKQEYNEHKGGRGDSQDRKIDDDTDF